MNKRSTAGLCKPEIWVSPSTRQEIEQAVHKFSPMLPSGVEAHPGRCCLLAREWFRAQARAQHALFPMPTPWLRERWSWGPLERPAHWCDIVKLKTIDCAALAALTAEALMAVGEPVLPVQILETFDDHTVQNWEYHWRNHGGGYWISRGLVYHEVVAVKAADGRGIRIWDPTEECYCEQRPNAGHGAIVAVRVILDAPSALAPDGVLSWRGVDLHANQWRFLTD